MPPLASRLIAAPLVAAALLGCVPLQRRATWVIYPLQRSQPHDGLAVVNQPDGFGLHIWLETDSTQQGVCRPRWLVDPARLFNGNGSVPFSSGLATRQEFFDAVARKDVRRALRRELEALCKARAPRARWQWQEPPRDERSIPAAVFPSLEENDLLSPPEDQPAS